MDISGIWKDLKTTLIGLVVIIGVTVAMFKGLCSFDRWWEIVLIVLGLILGGGLMLSGKNKDKDL
jgi:uncharacterized membrane protein YqaE (UPF0057 family)